MTTLIEVANTVADQLARNDLGPQISKEITNAVIRYSRRLTYLTEVRGGVMLLNDDQVWYDSFSMNPAYGLQPTENRIAVPFKDVVKVNFARYANVGQVQGLLLESNGNLLTENEQLLLLEQYLSDPSLDTRWYTYLQHEHYGSGEEWGSVYVPCYRYGYTIYAGQMGIREREAGGAVYISANVKPLAPELSTDESVFFDEARELIEAAAAKAVCAKYISDSERALVFAQIEEQAFNDIERETATKASTGRIRARW